MNKKVKLYIELLATALAYPFALLRQFSLKNLKTLFYAIRSEPPIIILKNFRRLLTQNQVAEEDIFLHRELRDDPNFAEGVEKTIFYNQQYQKWLQQQPKTHRYSSKRRDICFSIVIDTVGVAEQNLVRLINALQSQKYSNWEAILISSNGIKLTTKQSFRWLFLKNNNRAFCINRAIRDTSGNYVLWLNGNDSLPPFALAELAIFIQREQAEVVYADSDRIEVTGNRFEPHFKPTFNLDYLLSFDYIHSPIVVKKSIGEAVGWLSEEFTNDFTYDFYLKLITNKIVFHHCPEMLFHIGSPTVFVANERKQIIENYLQANKIAARVESGILPQTMRIKRKVDLEKKVSIIIPTKDSMSMLHNCVRSLFSTIRYPNFDIFIISNNSEQPETYEYLENLKIQYDNVYYERYDAPFNFAEINNWAVKQVDGEYILFLNNDIIATKPGWLENMISELLREQVGAVGSKLLYTNNLIQHAGVLLKVRGTAEHGHKLFPADHSGYFKRLNVVQEVSAVTGACLLTRRKIFQQLEGFDAENFPVAGNDIDYCLKLRQRNYLIVYTPYSQLYHLESVSRGTDTSTEERKRAAAEVRAFWKKWNSVLESRDPYYHTSLSLMSTDFVLDI